MSNPIEKYMKRTYSFFLFALAILMLSLTSCVDSAVDDLNGEYPAPDELTGMTATNEGVSRTSEKHIFHVKLSAQENIHIVMVGNKYYLQEGDFSAGQTGQLQNNTYLTDSSYVETTTGPNYFTSGTVSIQKTDSIYTVSGLIWLQSGRVIRFSGDGMFSYVDDTPKTSNYSYSEVVTAESGTIDRHNFTLYDKSGNTMATIDVRTATGGSVAGTYKVAEGMDVFNPVIGQAIPGMDLTAFGMGVDGTTYQEGGSTYLVSAGEITIKEGDDGKLSFDFSGISSATSAGTVGTTTSFSYDNVSRADK